MERTQNNSWISTMIDDLIDTAIAPAPKEVKETKTLTQKSFISLDVLGEGAEGTVIKASVPEIGDEFALKVNDSRGRKSTMRKEYEILQELNGHPNILTTYGYMTDAELT